MTDKNLPFELKAFQEIKRIRIALEKIAKNTKEEPK